ncbi:ATPase [Evansella clarkii]|uniref:ATPase n=1 Tax=Evansella clarkii TaxID=79879 RepID=UPI000B43A0D3|nr:ATPase [Evansella clarkii]
MAENEIFIIPILISVAVSIIIGLVFSKIYKGNDKVDEGFELNYFKLSYRRKMIRTAMLFPFIVILLIIVYFFFNWSLIVFVSFALLLLLGTTVQMLYNYNKWKKEAGRKM